MAASNNGDILDERNDHSNKEGGTPEARLVDGADNVDENDLERNLYGNSQDNMKPVREGQGMGGQNFGQNNTTFAGNDRNNPSQYAGNTNAYFDRTEPSDEHPEDTNFKDATQDGAPDYDKAQPYAATGSPKPEKVERGNGENDRPHEEETCTEGTADNDEPNIPGPNELPDQQKVGEDSDNDDNQLET